MSPTDEPATALIRRAANGGHGNAEHPPRPVPIDPDLLAEFNAGVARARMEYDQFPFLRSACGGKRKSTP